MAKLFSFLPLWLTPGGISMKVSLLCRINGFLFGSPNARRANGIISAGFDIPGAVSRLKMRVFGSVADVPVYAFDRIGSLTVERLPRIWLSEKVANTKHDDGRRVFVECYPTSADKGGDQALELGDRYFGEGMNPANALSQGDRIECFKASEILYMHAARRGNRMAASRLREIYEKDLCSGCYWKTRLEEKAAHAKPRRRLRSTMAA